MNSNYCDTHDSYYLDVLKGDSMNLRQLQEIMDRTIKIVWTENIPNDYQSYYLLKEDSLKNAFYFHLRTTLHSLLEKHNLRIYTEFHYKGFIADIAIVKISDEPAGKDHLRDAVDAVLAVIEVKYKADGNEKPYVDDVRKIKTYLDTQPLDETQYYLAFVHEVEYENIEGDSWLTAAQQKWAKGRLTELSGHYINDEMVWEILSHNGMNEGPMWNYRFTEEELKQAASGFNEAKYSHELYHYFLDVVCRETGVTEQLRDAVKNLIYWKLGKVSTKKTPAGEQKVANGITYYVSSGTGSHHNFIEKATSDEMLKNGLKFRESELSYEDFKPVVARMTKTSIVLPTFFTHIWNPSVYPIFDVKVWKTYKWNKGEILKKNTKPISWRHYEDYAEFFKGVVKDSELEWRDVDKGLWSIGDKLYAE